MKTLLTCIAALACGAGETAHVAAESDAPVVSTATPAAAPAFRLMSAANDKRYRKLLPQVEDAAVQDILNDPRLILYTDSEIPKAYQFWSGQLPGLHRVSYNISADGGEPFGNGNREFPWARPAGAHRAQDVRTFRFMWLPRDENGRFRPVVWYKKVLRGDSQSGYAWTFPAGTVFGEVLTLRGPDRRDYTFEMRLRIRELTHWEVDVFRPFPTSEDLAQRIRELRPDWEQNESLVKLCRHVEGASAMKLLTLADHQPQRRTFSQKMGVDELPALNDDKLVIELLTTTVFRSAVGQTWREAANGTETCAPTTKAKFHIVPAGYDAGFIAVDNKSCMRCHNTVNQNVSEFDAGRDWYGRIRGSDGIFSFHPFDESSISDNGFGRSISMRRDLERAGVIARYDRKVHGTDVYRRLKDLPE
jgi:hypothetical protein